MTRIARLRATLAAQSAAFRAQMDEPDAATALRAEDRIGRQMATTRRLIARAVAGDRALRASRSARVSA